MAYSDLLDKRGQLVGYRFRISGCQYYWVSHSDVPTLTDTVGGTAYTRVEGAFNAVPNPLPLTAHPLVSPSVSSTVVELLDVDDALTDVWATERGSPAVVLAGDAASGDGEFDVVPGGSVQGLGGFDASGYAYVDNETVEYPANGAATIGIDPGNVLIRGKFAEGFESTDVDHDQYILATDALHRPVYSYLPFLWYREAMLEIFDLENTDNTETIARGFLIEPKWVGDDVFRLKIKNYAYQLQRPVFKHTEVKANLSEQFVVENSRIVKMGLGAFGCPDLVYPGGGTTTTLVINVEGTNDIPPATAFITSGNMPSPSLRWMPYTQMFVLVGDSDDGEIMGVIDYSYDAATGVGTLTVDARGCFGTPVGGDVLGGWPQYTPVQFLCVLAGDFSFKRLAISSTSSELIGSWRDNLETAQLYQNYSGVSPIDAILMLMMSTGDGTNNRGGADLDYDVLPEFYGLSIPYDLIDIDAFEDFKNYYVKNRSHVYVARESVDLMTLIMADLQGLYGGMVYAQADGVITIKQMRKSVPNDTITTIAEEDILKLETIGVRDVYNAFKFLFDQWPSTAESSVLAYDYRRRDALGENPAPEIVSDSLRGAGMPGPARFGGENDVRNRATEYLQLLGNGAPHIVMQVLPKHNDLEPGDYVRITHPGPPQIIANARGFSEQLALVIEVKPNDVEGYSTIRVMLLREEKTCLWGP